METVNAVRPMGTVGTDVAGQWRAMGAADFVELFENWVAQKVDDNRQLVMVLKYENRFRWRVMQRRGLSELQSERLGEFFARDAVTIALCEAELNDLEEIYAAALTHPRGAYNFRNKLVQHWFGEFLRDTGHLQDWQACGFDYPDLMKSRPEN